MNLDEELRAASVKRMQMEDAKQVLQAALEDLARVTRERDGLAAALKKTKDQCYASICSVDEEQRRGGVFANPLLAVSARFALATIDHEDPATLLAAHDRQVAARVLRAVDTHLHYLVDSEILREFAAQYEAGEREVPSA
jgi:hypothetical protein